MPQLTSNVVLYTRSGCHLCEETAAVLARHGLHFTKIDVDQDADLQARFGQCVPVVVIDGQERFRGRVDEVLLRRIVAHRKTP